MRVSLFYLFFILFVSYSFANISVTIERVIELTSQMVEEDIYYEIKNTGSSSISSFDVAIEKDHLSYFSINKVTEKRKENEELMEKLTSLDYKLTNEEKHNNINYDIIQVNFKKPLGSNKNILIKVSAIYTHMLTPKPAKISQSDIQRMLFKGNHFIASKYTSESQITEIRSMQVLSFSQTESPYEINEAQQVILFGPYLDVKAFSYSECFVHHYNTAPFITVDHLHKEIEISHWGNVAVEESYKLHHSGSELDGTFSRLDYMMGATGNSINEFIHHLPEGATDVYYRDIIGNISSSHVYPHNGFVMFQVQPRFVMFGGWNDEFKTGYNLPTNPYLSIEDSSYLLQVPFINNFENAVFDEIEIQIILPEGAYDIDISAPVTLFDKHISSKPTYLDTDGRVVVSFIAKNIISEHRFQKLEVRYKFEQSSMIREPIFLIIGYFCLFLLAILYFRTNMKIQDTIDEDYEQLDPKTKKLANEFLDLIKRREQLYVDIGKKNFAKKLSQFNMDVNASSAISKTLISKLKAHNPDVGSFANKIETLSKEKTIFFRNLQSLLQAQQTDKTKIRVLSLQEEYQQTDEELQDELNRFSLQLN